MPCMRGKLRAEQEKWFIGQDNSAEGRAVREGEYRQKEHARTSSSNAESIDDLLAALVGMKTAQ